MVKNLVFIDAENNQRNVSKLTGRWYVSPTGLLWIEVRFCASWPFYESIFVSENDLREIAICGK